MQGVNIGSRWSTTVHTTTICPRLGSSAQHPALSQCPGRWFCATAAAAATFGTASQLHVKEQDLLHWGQPCMSPEHQAGSIHELFIIFSPSVKV